MPLSASVILPVNTITNHWFRRMWFSDSCFLQKLLILGASWCPIEWCTCQLLHLQHVVMRELQLYEHYLWRKLRSLSQRPTIPHRELTRLVHAPVALIRDAPEAVQLYERLLNRLMPRPPPVTTRCLEVIPTHILKQASEALTLLSRLHKRHMSLFRQSLLKTQVVTQLFTQRAGIHSLLTLTQSPLQH